MRRLLGATTRACRIHPAKRRGLRTLDLSSRQGLFFRIGLTCLGAALVGAAITGIAALIGPGVGSVLGVAGALLVLVAVVTGLVNLLMFYALGAGQFFLFLRSLGSGRDGIKGVARGERPASSWEQSELPARRAFRLVVVIAFASAVINVAILTFLFSPLARNPIAIVAVALTGGVATVFTLSLLAGQRGRDWLRQFLTTSRE
jgi:hypothetical protein